MTNGIVDDHHNNHHRQSLLDNAPHRNQMNNHNNDYHDMQSHRSEIMSSVTSRPASMASTATIVHVHTQPPVKIMPAVQRDPSMKRTNSNHVVFHENPTAYHTIIKVLIITRMMGITTYILNWIILASLTPFKFFTKILVISIID